MPEHQSKTSSSPRLQQILAMVAARKTPEGEYLSKAQVLLLSFLVDIGPKGFYPGAAVIAGVTQTDRSVFFRAEKSLAKAGIITWGEKLRGGIRPYEISEFPKMTLAQLAALRELNSCQAMGNAILAEINPELPEAEQVVMDISEEVEAKHTGPDPAGTTTAIISTAPVTQAAAKTKRKTVKLTQEASEWFLANPDNMALYIRFGAGAYRKTRQECEAEAYSPDALKSETSLKPSQTDWLINKPANETFPFANSWTCSQHAGYYWHGVCLWRAANNIKLAFPNWGRLGAEVKRLVDTQTSWQAHLLIYNAIHFFDLVQHLIGRIGLGMILDPIQAKISAIPADFL